MKVWAKTTEFPEGKFLVIRRDGSVPAWPHFVLGARDPAAPAALRAYADKSAELGVDPEYVASVREIADDFERYRAREGAGDPDAAPHRKDDEDVLHVMRGGNGAICAWQSTNASKAKPKP